MASRRRHCDAIDVTPSTRRRDAMDALKEAAFLYCYSKEPWAELDFS